MKTVGPFSPSDLGGAAVRGCHIRAMSSSWQMRMKWVLGRDLHLLQAALAELRLRRHLRLGAQETIWPSALS